LISCEIFYNFALVNEFYYYVLLIFFIVVNLNFLLFLPCYLLCDLTLNYRILEWK